MLNSDLNQAEKIRNLLLTVKASLKSVFFLQKHKFSDISEVIV